MNKRVRERKKKAPLYLCDRGEGTLSLITFSLPSWKEGPFRAWDAIWNKRRNNQHVVYLSSVLHMLFSLQNNARDPEPPNKTFFSSSSLYGSQLRSYVKHILIKTKEWGEEATHSDIMSWHWHKIKGVMAHFGKLESLVSSFAFLSSSLHFI